MANKMIVSCRDCKWANLIQYDENPVLAECRKKPNITSTKFPYDIDVASTPRFCDMHKKDETEKMIEKRVRVRA